MKLHSNYRDFLDLMDAGISYNLCKGKIGYKLFWQVRDKLPIEAMFDIPAAIDFGVYLGTRHENNG